MARNCPLSDSLETVKAITCLEDFGDFKGFIVQRTYNDAGALNTITAADILTLAAWNLLKAATNYDKIQLLPEIHQGAYTSGEKRTEDLGRIIKTLGVSRSSFEGVFVSTPQSVIESIDSYCNEPNLSIYVVNEYNQIGALVDDHSNIATYRGIPVEDTFFVADKGFGLYAASDKNGVSWSVAAKTTLKFAVVTPAFDVMSSLKAA